MESRRGFFGQLAALAFTLKEGIWVPPKDIAMGGVAEAPELPKILPEASKQLGGILFRFQVMKVNEPNMIWPIPYVDVKMDMKNTYTWQALKGGEIIFDHGKQMLRGFHVMADVVSAIGNDRRIDD